MTDGVVTGYLGKPHTFRAGEMEESLELLASQLGVSQDSIKVLTQTHSDGVVIVHDEYQDTQSEEADALITNIPGLVLGIKTADCIPVMLYDPVTRSIGAIHAGRAGAKQNIVTKTLRRMSQEYGVQLQNIQAYLGPALAATDHAVFREEAENFPGYIIKQLPQGTHRFDNQAHLQNFLDKTGLTAEDLHQKTSVFVDVTAFVRDQLIQAGVYPDAIEICPQTTFQTPSLHSYRRDFPNHGLNLTYIMLEVFLSP